MGGSGAEKDVRDITALCENSVSTILLLRSLRCEPCAGQQAPLGHLAAKQVLPSDIRTEQAYTEREPAGVAQLGAAGSSLDRPEIAHVLPKAAVWRTSVDGDRRFAC